MSDLLVILGRNRSIAAPDPKFVTTGIRPMVAMNTDQLPYSLMFKFLVRIGIKIRALSVASRLLTPVIPTRRISHWYVIMRVTKLSCPDEQVMTAARLSPVVEPF